MRDWLSIPEAAALLAERGIIVETDTIRRWCLRGLLAGAEQAEACGVGRRWLIPRQALLDYVPTGRGGWRGGRKPRE